MTYFKKEGCWTIRGLLYEFDIAIDNIEKLKIKNTELVSYNTRCGVERHEQSLEIVGLRSENETLKKELTALKSLPENEVYTTPEALTLDKHFKGMIDGLTQALKGAGYEQFKQPEKLSEDGGGLYWHGETCTDCGSERVVSIESWVGRPTEMFCRKCFEEHGDETMGMNPDQLAEAYWAKVGLKVGKKWREDFRKDLTKKYAPRKNIDQDKFDKLWRETFSI